MKIEIITIHDPDVNYGSTLQSCGTYNFIKRLGYEVEIINYRPNYKNLIQLIKKYIPRIIFAKSAYMRRKKINEYFKKHAALSRKYKKKNELINNPPAADIYITGSDVIWNRDINPEGGDSSYYLGFVQAGHKIAYAPSMGEKQSKENISFIIDKIKDFDFISVREEQSRLQLIDAGLVNVECVLDPIFLMPSQYYIDQIGENKYGEYTLVYLMSESSQKKSIVDFLTKRYGDIIISFGGLKKKVDCDLFIRDAGVEDFLSLIYYAKNIITDSFHCIAFSLLFEKQFVYLPSIDSSMRIENILSYFALEKQIISGIDNSLDVNNYFINYENVTPLLEERITKSRKYLIDALNGSKWRRRDNG